MLAHWHYYKRQLDPLSMDWKNRQSTALADLTAEQVAFIIKTFEVVKSRGEVVVATLRRAPRARVRPLTPADGCLGRERPPNRQGPQPLGARALLCLPDVRAGMEPQRRLPPVTCSSVSAVVYERDWTIGTKRRICSLFFSFFFPVFRLRSWKTMHWVSYDWRK